MKPRYSIGDVVWWAAWIGGTLAFQAGHPIWTGAANGVVVGVLILVSDGLAAWAARRVFGLWARLRTHTYTETP